MAYYLDNTALVCWYVCLFVCLWDDHGRELKYPQDFTNNQNASSVYLAINSSLDKS